MFVKLAHLKLYRYLASYNFGGQVIGLVFVCASFTPSLLPRGWVLQGLLSGVLFTIGYGIGVLASTIIREFRPKEPDGPAKTRIKSFVFGGLAVLYLIFLLMGAYWQHQVRQLVGQSQENGLSILGTTVVLAVTIALLIFICRLVVRIYHWLKRKTARYVPRRIAYAGACIITSILVIGFINGIILTGIREMTNQAFSIKNGSTDSGIEQPIAPELSGSPASAIRWDTLGRQGRNFVSRAETAQTISSFTHVPAVQPIRIYSGLESAPSAAERAALAVKDLKRAGGFHRKILLVVTTTGTGWVDEQGVEGLEYMYNGNSAMVAMQYSYLPSWLSFLVDQTKAKDAGIELYNAVLGEWLKMAPDDRPKLVVFGESLGSFGSEAAYTGWSAFSATADGAVWVGPPNFNHLWRSTTAKRDAGSPEILPIIDNGNTVRYANKPDDFTSKPLADWQPPRAVYLQNPSDPIVWWSPKLLFEKPDWLREKRGADVSPATVWLPIITFWQVTGDMAFSTAVPDNHGHKYGQLPTDAWANVAPPDGWSEAQTDALKGFLSKR